MNVTRHAAALRPFRRDEFGTGPEAPTAGHTQAVNQLVDSLRRSLLRRAGGVSQAVRQAQASGRTPDLQQVVRKKETAHNWVQRIERVWDFYFELFGQRQSQFGRWLLGCDRIAQDCYQAAYLGLGRARSIPTPAPFSYMRTGFSPATFRRGIPLQRLGRELNPFPLIQLPYHRMVNPWTLGAILHEVGHNLHNDLGLQKVVPRAIGARLVEAGLPRDVTRIWVRWNRETFADLIGLLLGGPAVMASLMDVVGRSPESALKYNSRGPHPTPYLRVFLSAELLCRMGFENEARQYQRIWQRVYPGPRGSNIPAALLRTFAQARDLVVDTVCYRKYPSLGNRALAEVVRFGRKEQQMVEEAAARMARGTNPGVVPERFLIGASRVALDRRLARPGQITNNFYADLARR